MSGLVGEVWRDMKQAWEADISRLSRLAALADTEPACGPDCCSVELLAKMREILK